MNNKHLFSAVLNAGKFKMMEIDVGVGVCPPMVLSF